MNEAFEKWLFVFGGGKQFTACSVTLMQSAWQDAEAEMRKPMACGHPRACWVEEWDEEDAALSGSKPVPAHCLACEAVKQGVDATLLELREFVKKFNIRFFWQGQPSLWCSVEDLVTEIHRLREGKTC